jgi:hypothetical protein
MAKKRKEARVRRSQPYGVRGIPRALEEVIEQERLNLGDAISVLQCLEAALEKYDNPMAEGPFFPCVANSLVKMLNRIHVALDCTVISARLAAKPKPLADDEMSS